MGNNCIGNAGASDNICKTECSNGSSRIQPYPNQGVRKIFDDQLSSRRFTLEPISSVHGDPRRCDSTKRSANVNNHDNFSQASQMITKQNEQQQGISNSIYQTQQSQQREYSCLPCCAPISPSKRVSKIFSNPKTTQIQTPNRSRRQTMHEGINISNKITTDTMSNQVSPAQLQNGMKAEWSLSPVISPRSKFMTKNVIMQKTYDGVKCDISDVIDFKQESQLADNKSSISTNIFENEFHQNIDFEQFFKEIENNSANKMNNNNYPIKITELTIEDEDEEQSSQNNKKKEQRLYSETIQQEQTSLNYSESSICNISSLTPEQMMIVKSKYYQFESIQSNSDKSTQILENQSYNYTGGKMLFSREQILSPQRLSTVRASDNILSETIKRNSDPSHFKNVIFA